MSYLRSFEGYAPPARGADDDPFTEALISEATAAAGPFTLIETIVFDDPDADPSNPAVRDLTTSAAEQDPGYYRITWRDAEGVEAQGPTLYVAGSGLPPWAPSIDDVGALLTARTKVPGGEEAGTFTADTRPTATQVANLIRQAARRVSAAIGAEPCTADLREDARAATALFTAMLVEQSYYPEQTQAGGSSFKSLEALWKGQIATLTEAVGEACGGGDGMAVGEGGATAVGTFDDRQLIGPTYPVAW